MEGMKGALAALPVFVLLAFVLLLGCAAREGEKGNETSLQNISIPPAQSPQETSITDKIAANETGIQPPPPLSPNKTNATAPAPPPKPPEAKNISVEIPESIRQNCMGFLVGDKTELRTVSLAGAGWARPHPGPFAWGWIEPSRGEYSFEVTDGWVTLAQMNNVSLLATVWPFADWDQTCRAGCEVSREDQFYPRSKGWDGEAGGMEGIPAKRCKPCDMEAYKKFLGKLVERYDGDGEEDMPGLRIPIKYYEISNEPEMRERDLTFFRGSASDYVEILKASGEAVKGACSDCVVVQGGSAGLDESFVSFWDEVYSLGGAQYYDVANIHFVSRGDRGTLNTAGFRKNMKARGIEKPVWVTEAQYGEPGSISGSFDGALGAGAVKIFFTSFQIGVMGPPEPGKFSSEYAGLAKRFCG